MSNLIDAANYMFDKVFKSEFRLHDKVIVKRVYLAYMDHEFFNAEGTITKVLCRDEYLVSVGIGRAWHEDFYKSSELEKYEKK